uniref:Uncharacterized protein n=1 Tax=Mycena chlorophos TaxID=658473 RepID=A0ABQ0L9T4_MYCCL|nr:predicted protein [Mycena chlorophos]
MPLSLRRKDGPVWDTVFYTDIEPVHNYYDEDKDLDVVSVAEADASGSYTFNFGRLRNDAEDLRNAVLLEEIGKRGYNALLSESWSMTLFRRNKRHRVAVVYSGRPARMEGDMPPLRPPPFLQLLRDSM